MRHHLVILVGLILLYTSKNRVGSVAQNQPRVDKSVGLAGKVGQSRKGNPGKMKAI